MKRRVLEEVGEEETLFLDATAIATALLGDSIASNLFLLGVAFQRGLVPVSGAALERAVELNAVAVEFNKQAFLYGRRYAHRPEQVLALLPRREAVEQPTTLDALIDDRAARLVEYQDEAYAGAIAARSNGCATWTRARRRRIRRPPWRRKRCTS
jgi:indolepyruvate ferredoxin oxidoreductase